MRKYTFIALAGLLVLISWSFTALHNIDNVFNALNMENSLMQDSSIALSMNMANLYTVSAFMLFACNITMAFIILCLLYAYDDRRTGHSKTGAVHQRARTD